MKKFIVIAYDISDDKKRTDVSNMLLQFGKRVNLSVFECFVTSKELEKIKKFMEYNIDREDSVIYYHICKDCLERIERQGKTKEPEPGVKVF